MSTGDGLDSELESFRKQWLSDLQTQRGPTTAGAAAPSVSSSGHHRRQSNSRRHDASHQSFSSSSARPGPPKKVNGPPSPTAARRALILEEGSDYLGGRSFDEPAPSLSASPAARTLAAPETPERRLVSALDHYEEAMEKEAQGNMGDSLHLYRKAYKMDHGVERRYREKHFPTASAETPTVQPSGSSSTGAPTSATATSAPASAPTPGVPAGPPKTLSELLEGFAALQIEPATADDPAVEGEVPPTLPCPIASLPDELLTHILHDVAVADVAEYVRLSLVCRRLAYLVAREQRIWRRVCLGAEFGFAGMHYRWNRGIEWGPLSEESEDEQAAEEEEEEEDGGEDGPPSSNAIAPDTTAIHRSPRERAERRAARLHAATLALTPSVYPTWRAMFRARPRIRFGGCYISTVNYVRSGQASTNQLTWGAAPIHIVTYYRYLRFFRDGSLISLLASDPPADVVHYMTRDALRLHRDSPSSSSSSTAAGHHASHLPGAVMRLAHRGRWRLSPPRRGGGGSSGGGVGGAGAPSPSGDDELSVETEGVGSKYVFKMDLRVRSAGKPSAPRGNKLVLCGFYSYNKLTEDWAEFLLKNNKPFFFSRVRSYGLGE